MIKFSTVIFFSLFLGFANAEPINYELYQLNDQGVSELLTSGTRDYTPKEIEVQESKAVTKTESSNEAITISDGEKDYKVEFGPSLHFSDKGLAIKDGFVVGARIYRDKKLTGFGLWLKRKHKWYEIKGENGCSWDWFDKDKSQIFSKLQGSGKVKVTTITNSDYEELTAVEFLKDVVLRLDGDKASFFSQNHNYNMLIKKGSILKLVP